MRLAGNRGGIRQPTDSSVVLPKIEKCRRRGKRPAPLRYPSSVEEGLRSLCENLIQAVIPSEARNLALNVFNGRARFIVACVSSE